MSEAEYNCPHCGRWICYHAPERLEAAIQAHRDAVVAWCEENGATVLESDKTLWKVLEMGSGDG